MSDDHTEQGQDAAIAQMRAELAQLRRDVDALQTRGEILACLTRYSRGLDRHDDELLSSVYHSDAVDHHFPFIGGPDEFVPWAHALHADDYVAHNHYVMNHTLDVAGDTAHSELYFQAVLRRKDGLLDLRGGRYIDRLERREGVWRVAGREVLVDWASTTGGAVLFGHPAGTWDRDDVSYMRPLVVPAPDTAAMDSL